MARASYHHGHLQEACVEAGTELLLERGPEGFSMREVARRAGVASSAPYRHFEDRAALIAAIARSAQQRLDTFVAEEAAAAGDSLAAFRVVGMAVVRFALAYPALYRVLQNPSVASRPEMASLVEASDALDEQGLSAIAAAQADGIIKAELDPTEVLLMGETITAGLADQIVSGHFQRRGLDDDGVLAFATQAFAMFARSIVTPAYLER
jgi:AcrR family transcriptional regulator